MYRATNRRSRAGSVTEATLPPPRLQIPDEPPKVPRRPPSKGNKRETLGDIAKRIPVQLMRQYFNYPLRAAAEVCDTCVCVCVYVCACVFLGSAFRGQKTRAAVHAFRWRRCALAKHLPRAGQASLLQTFSERSHTRTRWTNLEKTKHKTRLCCRGVGSSLGKDSAPRNWLHIPPFFSFHVFLGLSSGVRRDGSPSDPLLHHRGVSMLPRRTHTRLNSNNILAHVV